LCVIPGHNDHRTWTFTRRGWRERRREKGVEGEKEREGGDLGDTGEGHMKHKHTHTHEHTHTHTYTHTHAKVTLGESELAETSPKL